MRVSYYFFTFNMTMKYLNCNKTVCVSVLSIMDKDLTERQTTQKYRLVSLSKLLNNLNKIIKYSAIVFLKSI